MISIEFPKNVALCRFINGISQQLYAFKVPKGLKSALKIDDIVVVDTSNGLQVAQVKDFKTSHPKVSKYVIDIVHMEAFKKSQEEEAEIQKLKECLAAKKKEFEQNRMYEMMAEKDPEVAKMLQILKDFGEGMS